MTSWLALKGLKKGSAHFGFPLSSKRLASCLVFDYGLLNMVLGTVQIHGDMTKWKRYTCTVAS
jgi:hypothetical protein